MGVTAIFGTRIGCDDRGSDSVIHKRLLDQCIKRRLTIAKRSCIWVIIKTLGLCVCIGLSTEPRIVGSVATRVAVFTFSPAVSRPSVSGVGGLSYCRVDFLRAGRTIYILLPRRVRERLSTLPR